MPLNEIIKLLGEYPITITVDNDNEVLTKMNDKLDDYCKVVKQLDEDIANRAISLKEGITGCFKEYCNGNIYKATKIMNELVKKYENNLYIHDMKYGNSINIYKNANMYLYKGAVEDWTKILDRNYMLHIPFDKREVVKTQRFSMPGVPCLYLGQSFYIIWEELNRPSLDKLFVSRFELHEDTKVIDLGLSIFDLAQLEKHPNSISNELINQVIDKFLLTNIFKIACLIRVKQGNRYFKSEYIIPQLLLMSVFNLGIADGIRYSSVKVDNDSYIYANFAFPAIQDNKDENLSGRIINKVKLTQPINIGLYDFVDSVSIFRTETENLFRDFTLFEITNEFKHLYKETKFFDIELKINNDFKLESIEHK